MSRQSSTIKAEMAPNSKASSLASLSELFATVSDDLALIEARMKQSLPCEAQSLTQIAEYLLSLGGKRVRPLLAILSARLFRQQCASRQLIEAAAGIELIHMATLLHDDIIDAAPLRRHQESAYKKFGLPSTLLAGDFLLVKAFGLCAKLDQFIITHTENACVALTEGEELEGTLTVERDFDLNDYRKVVEGKTASLFSLAATVGAHCAGADPEFERLMLDFGRHAGVSFQMIDDVLDIVANQDLLGKPSGTDLRQRTPSLVNVLWLQSGDPRASEFFSSSQISDLDVSSAVAHLKDSDIIARSRDLARKESNKARDILEALPTDMLESSYRDQLLSLLAFTLNRCL